jgi:hypothetical protein
MTTTITTQALTAGEVAILGKTLYNKSCTFTDCHARFIEGSESSGLNISQFANAEVVFNIISSLMHLGISDMEEEAPSEEEYLQVLAFLLIQDDFIQAEDSFGRSNLPDVLLAPPPTTTAVPTTTQTTITTTTTPIMATWGELASRGTGPFSICTECHGERGGGGDFGPEIIGTTLQSFGDAWRLFAYISTQMPWDGPGSLSNTIYQRILAYMLIESGFVQPEAIFDETELPNILLIEELDM